MNPRDAILGAIRASLGHEPADAANVAREAEALIAAPARFQPKFDNETNRSRFMARATSERLTATVDEVGALSDAPGAVRNYLVRANLPLSIARPPAALLRDLDWGDVSGHETLSPDEPVAVNIADWAIAETGTLVFTSRPDSPTLFNYLPLHHVILLDGGKILRYPEDYWAKVRQSGAAHPRSTNFITGTSGTADIEGQNIRGAHGPRFMHIVIFGGAP
ncbi:MAG: lactate utilization protein [Alphaproteobacteria bacterium]|nr:lactate utilization protein [Alphaproteobacteria bacterium]